MFKILSRYSFSEFFLAITLVFFSLSHFVALALGMSLVLMFLIIVFSRKQSISINRIKIFKFCSFFIVLNLLVSISTFFDNFYLNNYVKFFAIQIFFFMFLFLSTYCISEKNLDNSLKIYLYIQATIFFIQLIIYILFNFYINFDELIRDENAYALYETKALIDSFIPIRATGLYAEPSFYSMFVLVPAAYFLSKGILNFATILAIITSLISLSIVSIICCSLMIMFFLITNKRFFAAKVIMIVAVIILFPTIYSVYQLRVYEAVDYDAIASRSVILKELYLRNNINDIIGSGFFWNSLKPIGETGMFSYHITDSSTYIYLYYCSGIIGSIFFAILMLHIFSFNKKGFFYLLCILLFKFQILIGFFWLAIYLIGFKSSKKQEIVDN